MIFGLGAALGWGLADLGAAVVSRRIGSLATVVVAQVAGSLAVVVLYLVQRPAFDLSTREVLFLLANGVMAAFAYLVLYRALVLGPVALVSPIVAAYAAVTIPLAVMVLHESIAGLVLVGALVTIAGVVLTSIDPRQVGSGKRATAGNGVPLALASMFLFGVATFLLGRFSKEVGWLQAIVVSRATTTVVLLGVGVAGRRAFRGLRRPDLLAAASVGLIDIVGVSFYSRGSELGLVTVVAAVSATFPLIPVVGGLVLFRERLAGMQAVGVALVIGGLVLLGLGG